MPITGTFFLVPNHLGSTALVTDASGTAVLTELHYEPYGEIIPAHSSGPDIIRNKYSGQVHDAESSLSYYGSRYYDGRLGRFISADTVVPDASDSQGYNRYMYVRGNPVQFIDPGGYGWFSDFLTAAVAAIAVAVLVTAALAVAAYLMGAQNHVSAFSLL
jgi:RHS repeat-associated protein